MLIRKISRYFSQGDTRSIEYKKNTALMFFLKGLSLIISLLYVPLLLNTLDTENYGIWLTLTSIVSWIAMMDIGLGNGIRNKLSAALAEKDFLLSRKYVSSAYIALLVYVTLFFVVFFLCIFRHISWNTVLNACNLSKTTIDSLVIIVFLSFGMQFVLNLINSILLALQKPATSSLITTLGQVVSFLSVFVCVKVFNISSLLVLGSIVSLSPVIVILFSSIILFAGKYRYLCPSLKYYDNKLIKDILKLGVVFFLIQLITIILYQSNNLIITHVVGNTSVVEYNIAYKYFQVLYMLYMIIVTPMWSATTQAYALRDFDWIKTTRLKLKKISIYFSICGAVMLILSPVVYKFWIGEDDITIMFTTSLLLYISEVFRMFYGHYGYIINGIGKLYAQLIISGITTMLYIPLTIVFGHLLGLAGILMMNAVVNFVNYIWSKYQYTKLMNNTATEFWNK